MRSEAAQRANVRLRIGVGVGVAVGFALAAGTELHPREVAALPLFLVFFPALAWAQLPLLEEETLERIPVYIGSILSISLLGALAFALGVWGYEAEALGLVGLPVADFLLWTAGLTLGAIGLTAPLDLFERRVRGGPHPILLELLPRTAREKEVFAGLSFTAGWGEEIAYRGYLPAALLLLVADPWLAMAVAGVAFGLLHSYQGGFGVVRTTLIGFLLGIPVVVTGSILPSMAAHFAIDLVAGFILGPRILREADRSEEEGVPSEPPEPPTDLTP